MDDWLSEAKPVDAAPDWLSQAVPVKKPGKFDDVVPGSASQHDMAPAFGVPDYKAAADEAANHVSRSPADPAAFASAQGGAETTAPQSLLDRIGTYAGAMGSASMAPLASMQGGLLRQAGENAQEVFKPIGNVFKAFGDPTIGETLDAPFKAAADAGHGIAESGAINQEIAAKDLIADPGPNGSKAQRAAFIAQQAAVGLPSLGLALGAATVSPALGAAVIGGQSAGETYNAEREAGKSVTESNLSSLKAGAIGAATAELSLGRALAPETSSLLARVAQTTGSVEAGTILMESDAIQKEQEEGKNLTPEQIKYRLENAVATSALTGPVLAGVGHATHVARGGETNVVKAAEARAAEAQRLATEFAKNNATDPATTAAAAAGDPAAQGSKAAGDAIAEAQVKAATPEAPQAPPIVPVAEAASVAPEVVAPAPAKPQAPVTAEPVANGSRVLFRGDPVEISAKLASAGVPEGVVKQEAGQPVGVYYPKSYADTVAKALGVAPEATVETAPVESADSPDPKKYHQTTAGNEVRVSETPAGSNVADEGTVTIESRRDNEDGNSLVQFVTSDGKLVTSREAFTGNKQNPEVWTSGTPEQKKAVIDLLHQRANTPVGSPERAAFQQKIQDVINGSSGNEAQVPSGFATSIEPIRNGGKVLFRGDVDAMRARLAEAGIDPGYAQVENGSKVGVYFPATVAEKVSAVLKAPEGVRQDAAEQTRPQPLDTVRGVGESAPASDHVADPVGGDQTANVDGPKFSKRASADEAPAQDDSGPKFSFAGERALTADRGALNQAQEIERMGRDSVPDRNGVQPGGEADTHPATGWSRGKDGKWRFEIDDSGSSIKPETAEILSGTPEAGDAARKRYLSTFDAEGNPTAATPKSGSGPTVGDILNHPKLFNAYPHLADVKVQVDPKSGSTWGSYNPRTNTMTLKPAHEYPATGNRSLRSVMVHELTHGIQEHEGFARGSNAKEFSGPRVKERDALNKRIEKINEMMSEAVKTPEHKAGDSTRYNALMAERSKVVKQLREKGLLSDVDIADQSHKDYRAQAGEVEARNAQARLNMMGEGGERPLPSSTEDVPRSEQGVKFNNREDAAALEARETPEETASHNGSAEKAAVKEMGQSAVSKLKARAKVVFMTKAEILKQGFKNVTAEVLKVTDGFFDPKTGKVVIVSDSGAKSFGPTVVHELVHSNLEKMIGKAAFQKLLDTFSRLRTEDPTVKAAREHAAKVTDEKAHLSEENLAHYAQKVAENPGTISQSVVDAVKLGLNRLGVPLDWMKANEAAVRKIIALNVEDALAGGNTHRSYHAAVNPGGTQFSRRQDDKLANTPEHTNDQSKPTSAGRGPDTGSNEGARDSAQSQAVPQSEVPGGRAQSDAGRSGVGDPSRGDRHAEESGGPGHPAQGSVRDAGRLRGGDGVLPVASSRDADGSLRGLPRKVGKFSASADPEIHAVAADYMAKAGLKYDPPTQYVKVSPEHATRVADAYAQMKHDPNNPEVKAAYKAMVDEVGAQYQAAIDAGLKVEFIKGQDPYGDNPRAMTDDVRNNNHMWVYSTRDGFGSDSSFDPASNPLLAETAHQIGGQKALANDLFRVVHDYYGHAKEGVGFRADGEDNAWRAHAAMFSPEARRAMTTETRGQNSWVNYGPHGEANRTAHTGETVFADQKTGLLPEWVEGDMADGGGVKFSKSADGDVPADVEGERNYRLKIDQSERTVGKASGLSSTERSSLERDGQKHGMDPAAIAKVADSARKVKRDFPSKDGWAPMELVGIDDKGKAKWKTIPYAINRAVGDKATWKTRVADKFEALINDIYTRAAAGDVNAKTILDHQAWYRNVTNILRRDYGGSADMLSDLLGATSPNTPVATNWKFAVDVMRKFARGDFDAELAKFDKFMRDGGKVNEFPASDKIRQASGKLYGMNSDKAMKALLDAWRTIEPGGAPKARNFALNLIGQSSLATIDVWAARMLRRAANEVRGADLPRIPPPSEGAVQGNWNVDATKIGGEFGFGVDVMADVAARLQAAGHDITAPDLQAVAWFAEKELWAKNGWTTKEGEGGSFEEQIDKGPAERWQAGISIQRGEIRPSDEKMSNTQALIMSSVAGDKSVITARAMPTTGLYGGTAERSFDVEVVADRGKFNPDKLISKLAEIAKENDQKDIFISRALHPDEKNANARPGAEIFFKDKTSLDAALPILDEFTKNGVDGFTMVVDPRAKVSGKDGFIGIRLQYVPEISMRFDSSLKDSLLSPDGIENTLSDQTQKLDDLVAKVRDMDGVAHAAQVNYDTHVIGQENYDGYIDRSAKGFDRPDGANSWSGQPIREGLERAAARLSGEHGQVGEGRLDGPDSTVRFSRRAASRAEDTSADPRTRDEEGNAEPGVHGRDGRASERDVPTFRRGKRQTDAAPEVAAVHYGTTAGLTHLDPTFAGTGATGAERRRFGMGRYGEHTPRLYFYVNDGKGVTPEGEVASSAKSSYHVKLENLYDADADPRGLKREAGSNRDQFEESVEDAGFDGFVIGGGAGQDGRIAVVTGSKTKVPVAERGVDSGPKFSKSADDQGKTREPFYSALTKSVEAAKGAPKKVSGDGWKQWLDGAERRGEFKPGERAWMGVDQWLAEQKKPVTREELQKFVADNQVKVQVKTLGEGGADMQMVLDEVAEKLFEQPFDDLSADEQARVEKVADEDSRIKYSDPAKFASYQLPGGENYREVLLTLPDPKGKAERSDRFQKIGDEMDSPDTSAERYAELHAERSALHTESTNESEAQYHSGHFDEPNILAHLRLNDRTGPNGEKVLHVEEIQSDWHQAGRKKGYGSIYDQAIAAGFSENEASGVMTSTTPEALAFQARIAERGGERTGVPDAPFKKEWPMLAFKQALHMAAEGGYDRMTWTTGEQQAARYDLSKKIERLDYQKNADGTYDLSADYVGRGGTHEIGKSIPESKLEEHIGKEVAKKIIDGEGDPAGGGTWKYLNPTDLKTGGEGMKAFYDKMLPNEINKYVKQWGGKVGESSFATERKGGTRVDDGAGGLVDVDGELQTPAVHSIDITPAMKDSVEAGQPLFSRRAEGNDGEREIAPKKAPHPVIDKARKFVDDLLMKVAPMAAGSDYGRAVAKDYANSIREARWGAVHADTQLTDKFKHDRLEAMWVAADKESVAAQLGEPSPKDGMASLSPDERAMVLKLQAAAEQAFAEAKALGMVKGEGLPSYVPRMVVDMGKDGVKAFGRGEEGDRAGVIQNIRTLPLATAKLEEAIAGRTLINALKDIGDRTGEALVHDEAPPARRPESGSGEGGVRTSTGNLKQRKHLTVEETEAAANFKRTDGQPEHTWFTIDSPAFKTWKPDFVTDPVTGKSTVRLDADGNPMMKEYPIYVRDDFKGPLSAVMAQRNGAAYAGLMALKAKTMSVIMYSPIIHNAVEWGRALPAMPGKVLTFQVYFEGNKAKNDEALMRRAIQNGVVPIGGRGGTQDLTSMQEGVNLTPGQSFTAKVLAAVPGLFDPKAGVAVKRAVDKAGDIWHNKLLWDRIADLQMGLYVNLEKKYIGKGLDEATAGKLAARLANQFAGALPAEAMSNGARKFANLMLFSRSFTIGNLGVLKDAVTGLPKDVQAQILRDSGEMQRQMAVSSARRKAAAAIMLDMGLMYITNSIFQSSIAIMNGSSSLDNERKEYLRRASEEMQRVKEDPSRLINPLGWADEINSLTPQGDNEPGKKDRILIGHAPDGTAIYMRNPTGKIGEEFVGWSESPFEKTRSKLSTFARPTMAWFSNDLGYGRKVIDPYDKTMSGFAQNAGRVAKLYIGSQIPLQGIQAAMDHYNGVGNPTLQKAQVLGPFLGVTFSKGAPGGEMIGQLYSSKDEHNFRVQEALPDIRKQVLAGDIKGATAKMTDLGIPLALQRYYVRTTTHPGTRMSKKQMMEFSRYGSPDDRAAMTRFRAQQALRDSTETENDEGDSG